MKKIFKSFLCFVLTALLVCPLCVFAENKDVLSDNITYKIEGSTLTLEGYGDLVLTYKYLSEIPWYARRSEIDTIIVGEGITSIGEGAFADFICLTSVTLPQSLTTIGETAFLTCSRLENIVLPKRVTEIQDGAFVGCESLTNITIYGNVIKISDDAFYDCESLTIIGVKGSYAESFAKEKQIPFNASLPLPEEIMVSVNNVLLTFDQPPVIVDNRTLVPLRAIFEALGATVDWNAKTRTVTAVRGKDKISLVVDTNVLNKNGKETEIDVPAKIIGDRTMVPVRAISEALDSNVEWNPYVRTVYITD
ncbi:MAG: leucine-rich repeat protein [Clostridia bacterium]|nr:leucine-rich repeat protein [Clostridia bacterium]